MSAQERDQDHLRGCMEAVFFPKFSWHQDFVQRLPVLQDQLINHIQDPDVIAAIQDPVSHLSGELKTEVYEHWTYNKLMSRVFGAWNYFSTRDDQAAFLTTRLEGTPIKWSESQTAKELAGFGLALALTGPYNYTDLQRIWDIYQEVISRYDYEPLAVLDSYYQANDYADLSIHILTSKDRDIQGSALFDWQVRQPVLFECLRFEIVQELLEQTRDVEFRDLKNRIHQLQNPQNLFILSLNTREIQRRREEVESLFYEKQKPEELRKMERALKRIIRLYKNYKPKRDMPIAKYHLWKRFSSITHEDAIGIFLDRMCDTDNIKQPKLQRRYINAREALCGFRSHVVNNDSSLDMNLGHLEANKLHDSGTYFEKWRRDFQHRTNVPQNLRALDFIAFCVGSQTEMYKQIKVKLKDF